jgi:hypothetical protein
LGVNPVTTILEPAANGVELSWLGNVIVTVVLEAVAELALMLPLKYKTVAPYVALALE